MSEIGQFMDAYKEYVTAEELKRMYNEYRLPERPLMLYAKYRQLCIDAKNDTAMIIQKGGSIEEIKLMCLYTAACVECKTEYLDYERFYNDHKIGDIIAKYKNGGEPVDPRAD